MTRFWATTVGCADQITVMTSNSASSVSTLTTAVGGRVHEQATAARYDRRVFWQRVVWSPALGGAENHEQYPAGCDPEACADVMHARLAGVARGLQERPAIAAVSARI